MSKEKIFIFDTTLRDGAQTEGVNFSIDDKNKIATALSNLEHILGTAFHKLSSITANPHLASSTGVGLILFNSSVFHIDVISS